MNEMKNKLREAFDKLPTPDPDEERKDHNIRRATEEFGRHREGCKKNRQGFSILRRLTVKLIELLNISGGKNMQTTGKMIGGFAIAMLTVVIGVSIFQNDKGSLPIPSTRTQVESTPPLKSPIATQATSATKPTAPIEAKEDQNASRIAEQAVQPSVRPIEEDRWSVGAKGSISPETERSPEMLDSSAMVNEVDEKDMESPAPMLALKSELTGRSMDKMEGAGLAKRKAAMPMVAQEAPADYYQDEGRDLFEKFATATVHQVASDPVSTFSSDVDTASYAFVRRQLNSGLLPQKNAVRVEEMINYFDYDYPTPTDALEPFKPTVAIYPTPWNKDTMLLHIGVKGYALPQAKEPAANLVFLVDVSGSMNSPDKLPLAKNALRMLVDTMNENDTIGLVVYAGAAGVVLEPTPVKDKGKILAAFDNLSAGGSTAGGAGIRLAYSLAERNFKKEGVNRVMLFSDGDFNVGITDQEELKSFIEKQRQSGIFFSVFGFGQGNYNDALMQALAQNGNGNAAYIDTLNEARKVLVDEASSTLFTIATDLKFQVEFNPALVKEYRLIGYETRALNRADFNNDKVDAGDIGSGHRVTAIYEITPASSSGGLIDDLRYGKEGKKSEAQNLSEYAFLKIRYKLPGESRSRLISQSVDRSREYETLTAVPEDLRFGAAVAAFGQVLRGGEYTGTYGYREIIDLASGAKGADPFGYRAEFVNLVRLAMTVRAM
jgi:Ca-activated chloride channel family protein